LLSPPFAFLFTVFELYRLAFRFVEQLVHDREEPDLRFLSRLVSDSMSRT